ncbi:hypothetical protein VTJ83DRAFT_1883 [Remersonia thermophila]|uniref:Uncharacterized protein n=1 Tax=Remersonia thermophila TaxID=72144 RepID=A0ABR4DJG0_9PEZI
MLAAHHDQENRYAIQANAAKQHLQAKTPGARYPKTPLKVPLNDENAARVFNGKSVLGGKSNNENALTVGKGGNGLGKSGKMAMVTPAAPTVRAPLGNKTTNAKAKAAYQTPGVKPVGRDVEKTAVRPNSNRRLKQAAPHMEGPRLEVHADKAPLQDEEVEYAPPKPQDLPYESDVFPDGVLTFDGLKPENLFKGYYGYYFNRVGKDGKTALERDMEQRQKKSFERGEEQIHRDMDEFDWSIGDIPESKDLFKKKSAPLSSAAASGKVAARPLSKQPSTIAARRAASALSMLAKPSATTTTTAAAAAAAPKPQAKGFLLPKRKPAQPLAQSTLAIRNRAPAVAASRSTLGYAKGRSVSSAVRGTTTAAATRSVSTSRALPTRPASSAAITAPKPRALARSASTASTSSFEATITPTRYANLAASSKEARTQPDFLAVFDADNGEETEDDELLGGGSPASMDDEDGEFELRLEFDDGHDA